MSDEEKNPEGGDDSRGKRLLRSSARPIVAAFLGVLMGVLCSYLPASFQAPCEMVSHILPAACGAE